VFVCSFVGVCPLARCFSCCDLCIVCVLVLFVNVAVALTCTQLPHWPTQCKLCNLQIAIQNSRCICIAIDNENMHKCETQKQNKTHTVPQYQHTKKQKQNNSRLTSTTEQVVWKHETVQSNFCLH
jgi:hypothetical protein